MTETKSQLCECMHDRSEHVDGTCLDCDPRTKGCDHEFTPYHGEPAPYLADPGRDYDPEPEQEHVPSYEAEARAYGAEQHLQGSGSAEQPMGSRVAWVGDRAELPTGTTGVVVGRADRVLNVRFALPANGKEPAHTVFVLCWPHEVEGRGGKQADREAQR